MASITIRKLQERTKERLRVQAARSGLSLEAHARRVLQAAADSSGEGSGNLVALAQQCFGTENGVELELPPRGTSREPLSFE